METGRTRQRQTGNWAVHNGCICNRQVGRSVSLSVGRSVGRSANKSADRTRHDASPLAESFSHSRVARRAPYRASCSAHRRESRQTEISSASDHRIRGSLRLIHQTQREELRNVRTKVREHRRNGGRDGSPFGVEISAALDAPENWKTGITRIRSDSLAHSKRNYVIYIVSSANVSEKTFFFVKSKTQSPNLTLLSLTKLVCSFEEECNDASAAAL